MTETAPTTLSPATMASVQGVVRAKSEMAQWTKNLEQALADDLAATPPRLTHDEATEIAKTYGVQAPSVPKAEPKAAAPPTPHQALASQQHHPAPTPEPSPAKSQVNRPDPEPHREQPKAHEEKPRDDKAKKPTR